MVGDRRHGLVERPAARVAVDQDLIARRAPEQLITGLSAALPAMSHNAMSTAAIAVIVTAPLRQ